MPAGPRFVLTGTFHSLNRGDCAMQIAMARALRQRWPDALVAVHTPFPEDDRTIYEREGLEVIACSRRRPLRALLRCLQAMAWRAARRRVPLPAELRNYTAATAVIDLSGDGLTETFGWRCCLSHCVPLLLAHLLSVPFCLVGQTIGPFGRLEPWFRHLLSRAALVTARDRETAQYLLNNLLGRAVETTADVSFLLEAETVDAALQHISQLGPYDTSRPLIGITVSNLHNIRAFRGPGRPDTPDRLMWQIAEACHRLAQRRKTQFLIIPHVFGPGRWYDDRIASERLAAMLRPAIRPLVLREPLHPSMLRAIIGRCDMLISARMHCVISGLSQHVPTLAIAYSPKTTALMRRAGIGEHAIPLTAESVPSIAQRAVALFDARLAARQVIMEAMINDLLPAAKRNLDLLEQALAQHAR